jgi:hypothetical protein
VILEVQILRLPSLSNDVTVVDGVVVAKTTKNANSLSGDAFDGANAEKEVRRLHREIKVGLLLSISMYVCSLFVFVLCDSESSRIIVLIVV